MNIKQAQASDLQNLGDLCDQFSKLSNYPGFKQDLFIESWKKIIDQGLGAIFLQIRDGKFVGALGAYLFPDIYSGELIATEFFWYVDPKYRGRGMDLYYAYEDWAKEKKAKRIRMTHLSNSMPEGLRFLYQELGYREIEIVYDKELLSCQ